MKGRFAKLLMGVTLAGGLTAAANASATDTRLAKAAGPSLASSGVTLAPLLPELQALPPALSERAPSADVQRLLIEPMPAPACTTACGRKNKGHAIADELLNRLGTVPVLGAMMVPVTRGLMISTGEGTPPLKLAVVPGRITRGSGFVAIGRF
jgi:hypothetical protein